MNFGNVQTWTNLYVPSGPLGDNTFPPCPICPFNDCLARSEGEAIRTRGRIGMPPKERTRVRILAVFNNIRACNEHRGSIFRAIEAFANHASSDVIRMGLNRPIFTYTEEEATTLKSPILSVLSMWRNFQFSGGGMDAPVSIQPPAASHGSGAGYFILSTDFHDDPRQERELRTPELGGDVRTPPG